MIGARSRSGSSWSLGSSWSSRSRSRSSLGLGGAALLVAALAGCETTAEQSARLAKLGRAAVRSEKGLSITQGSSSVKVVSTTVLRDQNGIAAVVTLRNEGTKTLLNVPIAIQVRDGQNKTVFQNSAPGLEPSLTSVAALAPGKQFTWVNDQVQASGAPSSVTATVGAAKAASRPPPSLIVQQVRSTEDPASGPGAAGVVVNAGKVEQDKVVLYGVGLKGSKVVAAGRAILTKVPPRRPTRFQLFFIGDPRGAQLRIAAPATVGG